MNTEQTPYDQYLEVDSSLASFSKWLLGIGIVGTIILAVILSYEGNTSPKAQIIGWVLGYYWKWTFICWTIYGFITVPFRCVKPYLDRIISNQEKILKQLGYEDKKS